MARLGITLSGFMLLAVASAAPAKNDEECDTYPLVVHQTAGGWSDCDLKRGGEQPLWRGLSGKGFVRQIRFAFHSGRSFTDQTKNYFTVIRLNERPDGTGVAEHSKYVYIDGMKGYWRSNKLRRDVSREDVAKLNKIGKESGNWDFATGSWDGDEIYIHCNFLEMERVDAQGYRYASVNYGCNRPAKLVPLVEHLTSLAKVRPDKNGRY